MSWDLLCKFVEKKYLKDVMKTPMKTFRETKVFVFDRNQLSSCENNIPDDDTLFDPDENFRLPFPQIAIQDQTGITFFMDLRKDQFGLKDKRFVVSIDYDDAKKDGMIIVGTAEDIHMSQDALKAKCTYSQISIFAKGKITKTIKKNQIPEFFPIQELVDMREQFLYRMIEALHLIKPKNFILEETPKKLRTSSMKIPRMHERPIYTILNPNEIRQRMGLEDIPNEGSPKTPHERSGHFRTLRNEKFGDRVGERIWIKPTWIGTSEAQVGNKFYKVRLDL